MRIDGTLVEYRPDFTYSEGWSLFDEGGFLLGPKAFKSEAELAKTVLHETYPITVRPPEGVSNQEYGTQETMESDEFAKMSYKHLMGDAEDGELFGDEGGGGGVGSDG